MELCWSIVSYKGIKSRILYYLSRVDLHSAVAGSLLQHVKTHDFK